MTRKLWLSLVIVLAFPAWAWALDREKHISQYAHRARRIQDGYFAGPPRTLAQTEDGYIVSGTSFGLVRFDGIRMVPWLFDHKQQLPSGDVTQLFAARDGSLWIGTKGGVGRWKDQTLAFYASGGPGGGGPFFEARNGTVWFAMYVTANDDATLCKSEPSGIRCLGQDGFPVLHAVYGLTEDASGNVTRHNSCVGPGHRVPPTRRPGWRTIPRKSPGSAE